MKMMDRQTHSRADARAAGRDAGNRSMTAAGRTRWNEEDWDAAASVTSRLLEAQA